MITRVKRRAALPAFWKLLLCTSASFLLFSATVSAHSAPITSKQNTSTKKTHTLYRSPNLWSSVDVCNPSDQPDTIGIRGSMPQDGHPSDIMYMRFRVQYLDSATHKWVDVGQSGDSGFIKIGAAPSARQAGRSFQFVPSTEMTFTLRGVVTFEWKRGAQVVHYATRPTRAGHKSIAGADPANYSAATCVIG